MSSSPPVTDPFDRLLDYESRLQEAGTGFPDSDHQPDRWSGIAFRVGDARCVAAMSEISEIVEPPGCTRVPGTVAWFLGIANVRGTLVPVMDLHAFITRGRAAQARNARLLIHQGETVVAGFQVDDVFGMKRFHQETHQGADTAAVQATAAASTPLAPWLEGGFDDGAETWPILGLARFADSPGFLEVSRRAHEGSTGGTNT